MAFYNGVYYRIHAKYYFKIRYIFFEYFPDFCCTIWSDWSTSFKVRTQVDITPKEWRCAKDEASEGHLVNFIKNKAEQGYNFFQHHLSFFCDNPSTETVASYMNFQKVVEYCVEHVKTLKVIIRWTDGPGKQYKNIGTAVEEKKLAIQHGVTITISFH